MISSSPVDVMVRRMIQEAYHLTPYQLSGGPGWLDSDRFVELESKASAADEDRLRVMLQTSAQRFKLRVHRETREWPVYALIAGKNGAKLRKWKQGDLMP